MSEAKHKNGKEGTVQPLYSLQLRLKDLHDTQHISWRKIAEMDEYAGVSHTALSRIAKGIEPGNDVRKKLHLPEMLPAPVCLQCGEVHTTKRCTANDKPGKWPHWVRVLGHAGGEWQ